MAQILKHDVIGLMEYEVTFAKVSGVHIGRLTNGSYCHVGGNPIKSEDELREAIPPGPELERALKWWADKDNPQAEAPKKHLIVRPDGSYAFDDGSEIQSASELIAHLSPGPALEAALKWYGLELTRREAERKAAEEAEESPAGMVAKSLLNRGKQAPMPPTAGMPPATGEITIGD